jgi:hypothetical protein
MEIESRDYWFKIVEFLQQNWALIDSHERGAVVWFMGDTAGVFDEMIFSSPQKAAAALRRNGFRRLADDAEAQDFLRPPQPPFSRQPHPNGPIYSSGRFWK